MKTSQNKSPSLWLFVALSFQRNTLIFRPCLFLVRYQDRTQAQARFNLKPYKIWKLWLYHHPSDILHLSKRTIIRISPPLLSGKWNLKMKILIKNLISNLEDQLLALMIFFFTEKSYPILVQRGSRLPMPSHNCLESQPSFSPLFRDSVCFTIEKQGKRVSRKSLKRMVFDAAARASIRVETLKFFTSSVVTLSL